LNLSEKNLFEFKYLGFGGKRKWARRRERNWAGPAMRTLHAGRLTRWGLLVSEFNSLKRYAERGDVGSDDDRTVERRRHRRREASAGTTEVGGRRRAWTPTIDDVGAGRRCGRRRGSWYRHRLQWWPKSMAPFSATPRAPATNWTATV
jgi:hypothetical protein